MVILQKTVATLTQGSLERFVLRARRAAGLKDVPNVLVTSSAAVRELNRQFRGKNSATDVLSFPALDSSSSSNGHPRAAIAGDIAISADIAAENATRLGHAAAAEVKILVLHGILHLAGYDHERDNGRMARKEAALRRRLNLPVALIERVTAEEVPITRRSVGARSTKNAKVTPKSIKMRERKSKAGRRSTA